MNSMSMHSITTGHVPKKLFFVHFRGTVISETDQPDEATEIPKEHIINRSRESSERWYMNEIIKMFIEYFIVLVIQKKFMINDSLTFIVVFEVKQYMNRIETFSLCYGYTNYSGFYRTPILCCVEETMKTIASSSFKIDCKRS